MEGYSLPNAAAFVEAKQTAINRTMRPWVPTLSKLLFEGRGAVIRLLALRNPSH
jgi:hypothetical protein